jgi:hypothetical protein
MKKSFLAIATVLFFLCSCQKENIQPVPDFDQIDNTDTTINTDTVTHVYDTVQNTVDTQLHVIVSDVLSRTYAAGFTGPIDASLADDRVMGFEIGFVLRSDIEIYFDKHQLRKIVGIADSAYTKYNIYSFVSGNYTMSNGLYKVQANEPQYITLSMVISRDTSAVTVPVHMSVPSFDYRTLKNGQFKAQTVAINLKTTDVMF